GARGRFGINGNAPPLDVARHFAALNGCKDVRDSRLPDTDVSDKTRVTLKSWSGCQPGSGVAFYSVNGGGHQAPSKGKVTGGMLLDIF
ncbi:hypothetical protein ACSTJP_00555, partial [Vibrio parahaemolyticus]